MAHTVTHTHAPPPPLIPMHCSTPQHNTHTHTLFNAVICVDDRNVQGWGKGRVCEVSGRTKGEVQLAPDTAKEVSFLLSCVCVCLSLSISEKLIESVLIWIRHAHKYVHPLTQAHTCVHTCTYMHTFWFWPTCTNTFKYSCLLCFSQQCMTNTVMIRVPFYMCPNGSNLHNTTGISLTPEACYEGTFQQCLFKKYLFANFIIETLTASLKNTFVPISLLLFEILNASLKNTFVSIWSLTAFLKKTFVPVSS